MEKGPRATKGPQMPLPYEELIKEQGVAASNKNMEKNPSHEGPTNATSIQEIDQGSRDLQQATKTWKRAPGSLINFLCGSGIFGPFVARGAFPCFCGLATPPWFLNRFLAWKRHVGALRGQGPFFHVCGALPRPTGFLIGFLCGSSVFGPFVARGRFSMFLRPCHAPLAP